MDKTTYDNYAKILRGELIAAMGCTEPIAVAYAAAKAREALGAEPERITVRCSGNIVKNVKGVVVPHSGGRKGVAIAAILGAIGGDPALALEVLSHITPAQQERAAALERAGFCHCELVRHEDNLYICVEAHAGADTAQAVIKTKHDHVAKITRNSAVLEEHADIITQKFGDKSLLSVAGIKEFAECVRMEDVADVIERQIACNTAISDEGLRNAWGSKVGQTLLETYGSSVRTRARAAAAAGSDARMNGCAMPVVINSGSGNQGMTCSLPVITYARELGASHEQLIRALVLTNLIAIHQKRYIGDLSAYCGAVSAGTAAGCGIAWLHGEPIEVIERTIINALGNVGGIVCDGAKASCAAKIASAVEAGILGWEMARRGRAFPFGEGLVEADCEQTIRNIGYMGREGMSGTDTTILNIMLGNIVPE